MKNFIAAFKKCMFILLFLFFGEQLFAQCSISYQGPTCVGSPIVFSCNSIGSSNFSWDFNGEGANTSRCDPIFAFTSPGTKVVKLSLTQANGATCNTHYTLVIGENPVIKSQMVSNPTQCFANNSFCFVDSSTVNGSQICTREYSFDDGVRYSFNGNAPVNFCHSFQDPAGGSYGVTIKITACNGCVSTIRKNVIAKVLPSMLISFTSPVPRACDSVNLIVTNTSNFPIDSIQSFEWDWGDGTKTTGTKNDPSKWGVQVSHKYKTQGPNNGYFDVKLTVVAKNNCTQYFEYKNAAALILPNVTIESSRDSVCISDPEIHFKIKEGAIPLSANPLFLYEMPPVNANLTRDWQGSHKFSRVGPHIVRFSFTSVLPGCGRTVYDTILVVGPQAKISQGYFTDLNLTGYFQCKVTDSVRFTNQSAYYHNDKDMTDDDSVLIQNKGFNAPLVHVFNLNSGNSVNPTHLDRQSENVIKYWDFDDDFCEKCTTDLKNNINVNRNCRYSKDEFPTHLYKDWSEIYSRFYSAKPLTISLYNKDSGYVINRNLLADDSVAIVRDTILYYGNNPWGNSAKDSAIFNGLTKNSMNRASVNGPSRETFARTTIIYIRANNRVYIDQNNGNPPNFVVGPGYKTIPAGQSIFLTSNSDTVHFVYNLDIRHDTMALNEAIGMKILLKKKNPYFVTGDSIDANSHRQRFYLSENVRCMNVTLTLKDTKHPLACTSSNNLKLSLGQPSATNLRKTGMQCLGASVSNFGITFQLDETKPGCGATWILINPNVQKSPNNWIPAVGPNMSSGSISNGPLPPFSPPFLAFPGTNVPGNQFSIQYDSTNMSNSDGSIDVGLVIGNGFHAGGIYPQECQDTVIYKAFARFPILEPKLNVLSGKVIDDAFYACKMETIVVSPDQMPSSKMKDIGSITYSFTNSNAGKYHNKNYQYQITETYNRFRKVPGNPNILMDSLTIAKSEINGSSNLLSTQTFAVARIDKWHVEADISEVFESFKLQLEAHGLNINDYNPSELAGLIWNGLGTIGKAYTGSRGLVDTTGFGDKIRIQFIADQKVSLHERDTTVTPIESNLNRTNQSVKSYAFTPKENGFYMVEMSLNANMSNFCPKSDYKKVIVGFYMDMNYTDTIICPGQTVKCSPQFRYYNVYPDVIPYLTDPIDYWRMRIQEAGNVKREGYTRHDLNKDDDGTDPKSIFGGFPYSITGLDNEPNKILGLSYPSYLGGIYYNQDTGKTYIIRTAAMDSMGCRDTFVQALHVISARTKIKLAQEQPGCNSIFKMQDSSYLQDPIAQKTGKPSAKFVKRTVSWGDNLLPITLFNDIHTELQHTYKRKGLYRIKQTFETDLGCAYTDSIDIYMPGPIPNYDTFIRRTYCKGDTVVFDNLSYYSQNDSCIWIWDFGNGKYASQIQSLNSSNNPVMHAYDFEGSYNPRLYVYYTMSFQNKKFQCVDHYPNPDQRDNLLTITVMKCDSTGLENLNYHSRIDMFPNPASQYVQFKSEVPVELVIYNAIGQLVGTLKVDGNAEFDLRHLGPGIYLVKTIDQQFVGKLLVE